MSIDEKTVCESNTWFIYMLRCKDGSLYTGITTNVERRVKEHQGGGIKAAKSIKGKGPLDLVFFREMPGRSEALKAEYKIKQLPKVIKEQLITGDIVIQSILINHESEI